jgi:hypothetical protein
MEKFKRPKRIPQPDAVRTVPRAFGWIDAELLWKGWLSRLTPEEVTLFVFLSIVADRQGISHWRKDKIAGFLGLDDSIIHRARERLIEFGLVAFSPFSPGDPDGFYQLLKVSKCPDELFPLQ